MKSILIKLALIIVGCFSINAHSVPMFQALKDPECLTNVSSKFTVGGQYVDPGNGVLNNSYSMLVRWQGDNFVSNSVAYNVSNYTGFSFNHTSPFTTPYVGSISNWQRGVKPEDTNGSPAVQLYCNGGGMLINTWSIPHRQVVGGGYNDMFGYQWGVGSEPNAFRITNAYGQTIRNTDLIVQANIAVPEIYTYSGSVNTSIQPYPTPMQQVSLYAYVVDTSHPSLPPIALVEFTHDRGAATPANVISCDYKQGVWFSSGNTTYSSKYFTHDSASNNAILLPASKFSPSDPALFFRMRITPGNFIATVTDINASTSTDCPARGYSTNPDNYILKYAGVIAELTVFDQRYGPYIGTPTAPDYSKDQGSMGINFYNLGIYRGWEQ